MPGGCLAGTGSGERDKASRKQTSRERRPRGHGAAVLLLVTFAG